MRLLMRLPAAPISFTCLAALTTLARPSESFASSSLSLKVPFFGSTRGRVTLTSFTTPQICPAVKECRPTSSPKYTDFASARRSSHLTMATESPSSKDGLFLFDFDGVVCDSCDECTVSAWRTCQILNAITEDGGSSGDTPPKWLFEKMREMRPAIEVGWQIPVLLSVFLEQRNNATPSSPAMAVPEIIQNYETLVENWLQVHNLKEKNMVQTFGEVRDNWIASDLKSWLDINTFYNGISQGITDCQGEVVLVTTKQHRFATALVRHAGIEEHAMPTDSIYGLGMYKSKSDVIVDRMQKDGYEASNTHFFEDRWPTIAKCLKDDRLDRVKFYLCSWGYCTEEELKLAESEPRVTVLKLDEFAKVVMQ
mmetsp:Transcript_24600/g.44179  ORF Transcript_24600/g.44179 Transcript_24600/m.44179 type:complete len:367 (-) Transcript_24600:115-1215(-)